MEGGTRGTKDIVIKKYKRRTYLWQRRELCKRKKGIFSR